jgi:hypothetical protein
MLKLCCFDHLNERLRHTYAHNHQILTYLLMTMCARALLSLTVIKYSFSHMPSSQLTPDALVCLASRLGSCRMV